MTGFEVLLASAGLIVFVMVLAAMILVTPRGIVEVHGGGTDQRDSLESPATGRPAETLKG